MDWLYLNLVDGRLIDEDGYEANSNWPSFSSQEDAETWLEENDIRATVQ